MINQITTNVLEISPILYFVLIIALNIYIVKNYQYNRFFPAIFMLFEIVYAMSIIATNELLVMILLMLIVIYNFFVISYHYNTFNSG